MVHRAGARLVGNRERPMKIRSHFLREVAGLGIAQVIVGVCSIALMYIVSHRLTSEGLGLYVLARRSIAVLGPIILLGMDTALPRYVGMARDQAARYLTGAMVPVAASGVATLAIAVAFADPLARVVFRYPGTTLLFLAVASHWLTYPVYTVVFAYFRGLRSIRIVSVVWILYAAFPVAASLFLKEFGVTDAERLTWFFGITAGFTVLLALVARAWGPWRWSWSRAQMQELLHYGVPRVPSSFLLTATISTSVFLSAYLVDLRAVAILGVNLSALTYLELAVTPISLVLLPMVSELVGQRSREGLALVAATIVPFAWHLGLAVSLLLPGIMPDVTVLWVGAENTSRPIAAIFAVGAGWNLCYAILRGVINALTARPVVTYLTLGSAVLAAVLGVTLGRLYGILGLGISTAVPLILLGIATVGMANRYLGTHDAKPDLVFGVWIAGVAALVVAGDWVISQVGSDVIVTLMLKITIRLLALSALCFIAARTHLVWWEAATRRLGPRFEGAAAPAEPAPSSDPRKGELGRRSEP